MRSFWLFNCLMLCAAMGCGGEIEPRTTPLVLPPLSVEEWKTLPIEEKYDQGTFDRLREADEKLRPDRAWEKFMTEVVIPERQKDIPSVPGQS